MKQRTIGSRPFRHWSASNALVNVFFTLSVQESVQGRPGEQGGGTVVVVVVGAVVGLGPVGSAACASADNGTQSTRPSIHCRIRDLLRLRWWLRAHTCCSSPR